MKLNYYPGCSTHSSSKEYEISAKRILQNFDIQLEELKDWNCCGAAEASSVSHFLSVALPARNLTLGDEKIIMLCSACQLIHNKAKKELIENPSLKQEIEELIGSKINTDIEIKHLLHFISYQIKKETIKENVKRPLKGLRVVPYYGCLVIRPSRYIAGDKPEFPQSLEDIVTTLGATPIEFPYKTKCCGGALFLPKEDLSFGMLKIILSEAKNLNADCIAVVCPFCHLTLEVFSTKLKLDIPILYFTQLIGIAFGYKARELGLNRHLISAKKLLDRLEPLPAQDKQSPLNQ